MSPVELKAKLLRLAQLLAPYEAISANDAHESLVELVTCLCAMGSTTDIQRSLIAVELAKFIEAKA